MLGAPLSCSSCGTVLSAAGGRCPTCGMEQPFSSESIPHAPARASRPPSDQPDARIPTRPPPRRKQLLPLLVLMLGGTGLVGLATLGRSVLVERQPAEVDPAISATQSALPPAPIDPNDMGLGGAQRVEPLELLERARTRALAWERDAVLVSMKASPVVAGWVDLAAGGTIEFTFGKPTAGGFDEGTPVGTERLTVTVEAGGASTRSHTARAGGRATLEPGCALEDAVRKLEASGLPRNVPLSVRYERSDRHGKAVWEASTLEPPELRRTVDGWTCAIIVR